MVILLPFVLSLAVPLLLIVGWCTALRFHGVPRWIFFSCCAALPVLCVVVGVVAGDAEDSRLSSGCRDGRVAGLECGFGISRLSGYLPAFTGTVTLALLTAISLIVWKVHSRQYRGLPALTSDR